MSLRVWRIAVATLWIAVLGSSLAVVYGKHQARTRFIELQRLTVERDELDIEWGQLQLEQSTWGTHGRVERVARDDLKMLIPRAADLRIVQP
jgi:cell division protein FtsL